MCRILYLWLFVFAQNVDTCVKDLTKITIFKFKYQHTIFCFKLYHGDSTKQSFKTFLSYNISDISQIIATVEFKFEFRELTQCNDYVQIRTSRNRQKNTLKSKRHDGCAGEDKRRQGGVKGER